MDDALSHCPEKVYHASDNRRPKLRALFGVHVLRPVNEVYRLPTALDLARRVGQLGPLRH